MEKLKKFKLTKIQRKLLIRYVLPFIIVAVIVLIRLFTKNSFNQSTYALFILPVILQASFDGLKSGTFTLFLSLLTANFLYAEPLNTFKLIDTSQPITTVIYLIQSMIMVVVVNYILDAQKSLKAHEKEKDDFISMISHELKTPMTIIKGYLQVLHEQNKDKNILKILDIEMDKLNDLIEELYDVTKIQANKFKIEPEKIDLVELAKQSIKSVEPILDGHRIKLISDKKVIVNADPIRIGQVIENFLTNSIKYSYSGSEITIGIKKNYPVARVDVIDLSEGISQEDLKHLFDRYYQVNSGTELKNSLGLGLFISKKIIEQHNGKIFAVSKLNQGSTFSFELPL